MRVAVLVGVVATAVGCSIPSSEPEANKIMTRASLVVATAPSAELGEDCSAQRQMCKTGHCLATTLGGRPAFVCTVLCSSDDDCPLDFSCGEIAPRAYACIPSPNHTPRAVLVRSVVRTPPAGIDAGLILETPTDDGGR